MLTALAFMGNPPSILVGNLTTLDLLRSKIFICTTHALLDINGPRQPYLDCSAPVISSTEGRFCSSRSGANLQDVYAQRSCFKASWTLNSCQFGQVAQAFCVKSAIPKARRAAFGDNLGIERGGRRRFKVLASSPWAGDARKTLKLRKIGVGPRRMILVKSR